MSLAQIFEKFVGEGSGVCFTAYDGSTAGSADSPFGIRLVSPAAATHLARNPSEIGLARAYVAGDLEVQGDMYGLLSRMRSLTMESLTSAEKINVVKALGLGTLLRKAPIPPQEVRQGKLARFGGRHTKERDAKVIQHHYDVSNKFYEWVLGPSMAYTCAAFPSEDANLEQAQFSKFELVARKLDLKPGMRLLDVGCGWGGMVRHAAKEYGVKALGVTLSQQQADWAQKSIADAGLSELAEVRYLDYRDVPEGDFDAISSIGLTEHIGKAQLPSYFTFLNGKLVPGGRLLNHCITRPTGSEKTFNKDGFINRYIFPDGELESVGHIVRQMEDNGFEIRRSENLREHYGITLEYWSRNLDEHWEEAVEEVGPGTARLWRLYMAGCRLGFETNKVQLHQVLAVKLDENGRAGFPLRPAGDWPEP